MLTLVGIEPRPLIPCPMLFSELTGHLLVRMRLKATYPCSHTIKWCINRSLKIPSVARAQLAQKVGYIPTRGNIFF